MPRSELGVLVDAIGVAIERRKLHVAVVGLAVSWIPALFFYGLANQPRGGVLTTVFSLAVLWVGLTITGGVIARMSHGHFVSGERIPWRDAFRFVGTHIDGFLVGPLVASLGLAGLLIVEAAVMFLGRIPYLGELIAAQLFFPFVLVNIVAAITAVFGAWLLFPIVAAAEVSATQAPARVVALVASNPARVVVFGLVTALLMLVASVLLSALLLLSVPFTASVVGGGLGPDKLLQIVGSGNWISPMIGSVGYAPAFELARDTPATIELARFVFSLGSAGLLAVLYAVPIVFQLTLACSVYITSRGSSQPVVVPRSPASASPAS